MDTAYTVHLFGFNDWDDTYTLLQGIFSSKANAEAAALNQFQKVLTQYRDQDIIPLEVDENSLLIVIRDDDARISYDWKISEVPVDDPSVSEELFRIAI